MANRQTLPKTINASIESFLILETLVFVFQKNPNKPILLSKARIAAFSQEKRCRCYSITTPWNTPTVHARRWPGFCTRSPRRGRLVRRGP